VEQLSYIQENQFIRAFYRFSSKNNDQFASIVSLNGAYDLPAYNVAVKRLYNPVMTKMVYICT
jgi:hypothetical protein